MGRTEEELEKRKKEEEKRINEVNIEGILVTIPESLQKNRDWSYQENWEYLYGCNRGCPVFKEGKYNCFEEQNSCCHMGDY